MAGRVTLGVEIELGWGHRDLGRTDPFGEDRVAETERLEALLAACDRLDVPFTFDVVGALLLDSWPDDLETPYPDGWFDTVPKTGVEEDPLFYAPDVVEAIADAAVDHEICTHTFTHARFDRIPREVAAWELRQARRVHEAFGLDAPTSLVPPRHCRPPRDLLLQEGIDTLRIPGYLPAPTKLHEIDRLLLSPQPPTPPREVDGVVETYCSSYTSLTASSLPTGQGSVHPALRPLPKSVRKSLHERYLDRAVAAAVEADSYTHLWCRLHDLAPDDQFDPVVTFLEALAERQDRGEVEVLTMDALGDAVRSTVEPVVEPGGVQPAAPAADGGRPGRESE